MKIQKLTDQEKADYQEFKDEVNWWITAFGLTSWDIKIGMSKVKSNASCLLLPNGKKAYININPNRDKDITVKQLAIHEVLELLLGDISLLTNNYYSDEIVADEVHKIINRLMPILLEFKK